MQLINIHQQAKLQTLSRLLKLYLLVWISLNINIPYNMYFLHIEQMYIYETSLCMEHISCFFFI